MIWISSLVLFSNTTQVPTLGEPAAPATRAVEVQANSFSASTQENAALALAPSGEIIVVWQSRRQEEGNYGIYAQRFDPRGARLGQEVHVNQHVPGAQTWPCVAIDAAGAVWFAWESFAQDGDRGGIVARRFDGRLETSTHEVIVNEDGHGEQGEVALACDARGNALVAWTTPGDSEEERAIRARRLGFDGKPSGASFFVAGAPAMTLRTPSVALDSAGSCVIAWCRAERAGLPRAIEARRFATDGSAGTSFTDGAAEIIAGSKVTGSSIPVQVLASDEFGAPIEPVVAFGPDGELVAAWLTMRSGDCVPTIRRLAWFAEASTWQGGAALLVEDASAGYTSALELALETDGRARLLWNRHVTGGSDLHGAIVPRARAGSATLRPEPILQLTARAGDQRLRIGGGARRAAVRADGVLALAWSGEVAGGDKTAAGLTLLWLHADLAPTLAAVQAPQRFDEPADAAPHEPPILDPDAAVRRENFVLPESAGGPDYGFLGIPQTSLTPPDPGLSVGPNHCVATVNARLTFFTKTGAQTFTSAWTTFFASVGAGASNLIFDPETLFDPYTNRFLIMACERSGSTGSFFLVAVSDDADPNGTWFKYRFDVTSVAGGNIDSPNFSLDAQAVYLGADFFSPDRYLVFAVDKTPLLTGGVPTTRSLVLSGSHSYGMPLMYSSAPAAYMVQAFETTSSSTLRLHAITNALTAPVDTTFDLAVPAYTQPQDPPQLGTSSRPNLFEARFWSTTFRNGRLWATHHQGNTRAIQRWYEIDMQNWPVSGTPTLVQTGNVDLGAGISTYFGSIGVDAQNNMGLVFARSSASEFISMSRTFRMATDAPGTTLPPVVMRASTSPETSGRWGDYSSCVPDPTYPRVFWGSHEFRTTSWATWIGMFGPCSPSVPYCTAKLTSLGLLPVIGASGDPSVGSNNFRITIQNGMPNGPVIYFHGAGTNNAPFLGGTLCVAPPIVRGAVVSFDGLGSVSIPYSIAVGDVGRHRYFQGWFRDALQPDGTGVGLTGGLDVEICP